MDEIPNLALSSLKNPRRTRAAFTHRQRPQTALQKGFTPTARGSLRSIAALALL